ncbi:MAG TPA: Rne/Rng family ribonuclease, partial [Tepidisphaeraceae bacterium]|nr:Rne/Rng family ribonuclease [Tepidisphaeraceae bacterium]
EGEECRIALVQDRRLEELYVERTSATSHVGNIYKGRVTNVEPSIQAAFVDFGLGRNGFLHISDLMPTYFGGRCEEVQESVGRKMARRDRPPIQRCLHRGDEIIVQIIKEGIGTKGPTLSTYVSIPGRILVMMPGMSKLGVSRKIEDEEERRRLRQILDGLKPPKTAGFIIRTAGVSKSKTEIQRDLQYLTRLWQNIQKKIASGPGPMELYTEGDLVTRTVRDVFTSDIDHIVIDNKDVARRVKEFIKIALPRTRNKVDLYEEPIPLFHKYGIEKEIEKMYSRTVPLPGGGSLIIDATEAVVAIDVNSGKFRDHNDAEMTAFKTDLEAADEIPRQLRLRDLGGVIICDFIDLRYERHRRELEKRLHDNLHDDRAKTKMLRMSQFGIIEMTRQRMRPSLKRSIYCDCPSCKGAGLVKTPESMALDVMRRLAIAVNDQRVARVELAVSADVAFYLQNKKRAGLAELESRSGKRILIRSESTLGMDMMNLTLYDSRDGLVFLEELGMTPQTQTPVQPHNGQRPQGMQASRDDRRDRRDQQGQRDQRGQHGQQGPQGQRGQRDRRDRYERQPVREEMEDRFEIENGEESIEEQEPQQHQVSRVEPASLTPVASAASAELLSPAPEPMEEDLEQTEVVEVATQAASTVKPVSTAKPAAIAPVVPPKTPAAAPAADAQAESPRSRTTGRQRRSRTRPGRTAETASETSAAKPAPAAAPVTANKAEPVTTAAAPVQTETKAAVAVAPAPVAAEAAAPAAEPATPRRRSTRSSRPRSSTGRSRSKAAATAATPAAPAASEAPAAAAPQPAVAQKAPPTIVVRTGSTDRHLMREDAIEPPPISRPRTYRDLDHIPDDLD